MTDRRTLDHVQIRGLLPHRHPILLVDRVEELEYYDRIVSVKVVTGSEPCYSAIVETTDARRFAYPQPMMVESFGQSGAVLWLESIRHDGLQPAGSLILAGARGITFHRAAYPGDTLRHVAYIERIIGDNAFLHGRTWIGEELAAEYGSVIAVVRRSETLAHPSNTAAPTAAPTSR